MSVVKNITSVELLKQFGITVTPKAVKITQLRSGVPSVVLNRQAGSRSYHLRFNSLARDKFSLENYSKIIIFTPEGENTIKCMFFPKEMTNVPVDAHSLYKTKIKNCLFIKASTMDTLFDIKADTNSTQSFTETYPLSESAMIGNSLVLTVEIDKPIRKAKKSDIHINVKTT